MPLLLLASGCTGSRNVGTSNPPPPGTPLVTPVEPVETPIAPAPVAQPNPPPESKPSPSGVVGQKTMEIRRAEPERRKGAQVATTTIPAKDPITLQGHAYVTIIGRTAQLNIEHAMELTPLNVVIRLLGANKSLSLR